MTTRQLLEQALEAIEYHRAQTRPIHQSNEVIEAIRAHLSQPQGEPVAWMGARKNLYRTRSLALSNREQFVQPLYTHPAHTEAEVRELLTKISGFEAGEYGYAALETTVRRILGVPA